MGVRGPSLVTDPRGELLDRAELQCVWTLFGLPGVVALRATGNWFIATGGL